MNIQEQQTPKGGAKEFFLFLGILLTLATVLGSLLSLLFSIINYAFPASSFASTPSISFQVAALIVVAPIFLLLSWLEYKNRAHVGKHTTVRKWITAIILFATGAIVLGDLIVVLYQYIDGQDLTLAFLLKAGVILAVLGAVFTYYLLDIRNYCGVRGQKIAGSLITAVVLASIVLGFSIIGSPETQRLIRYDEQKVNDLSNIQNRVTAYYQQTGELPRNLSDLDDPLTFGPLPEDPQGMPYEYYQESELEFVLCAEFNHASRRGGDYFYEDVRVPASTARSSIWNHQGGYQCFQRTIDPDFFPQRNQEPTPGVN